MDRIALAIQETLKVYCISPDPNSSKQYLWKQFPEAQQELMRPLLSSRYTMAQSTLHNNNITPIYGSSMGSTFQLWIYKFVYFCVVKRVFIYIVNNFFTSFI